MGYPVKATLDYSYTGFQQGQGTNEFPGTQVDNDLANIKTSLDETIDFVSVSLASTGRLKAGSVGTDALAFEVRDALGAEALLLVDAVAVNIDFTPDGGIASTNVQDALTELGENKAEVDHEHSATQIAISPVSGLTSANVQAALAELRALGPQTGDVVLQIPTTAPAGWVMANDGTIGASGSGATTRANSDTLALYTVIWNAVSNTYAPVSTGRGANPAADFAALKTITLTKMLGRALAIAGSGSGLTPRSLGEILGAEEITLTAAEIPAEGIEGECSTEFDTYRYQSAAYSISGGGTALAQNAGNGSAVDTPVGNVISRTVGHAHTVTVGGGGEAHDNMAPTSYLNARIKL